MNGYSYGVSCPPNSYLLPEEPVDPFEGLTPIEAVELSERVQADVGMILRRATMRQQQAPSLILAR